MRNKRTTIIFALAVMLVASLTAWANSDSESLVKTSFVGGVLVEATFLPTATDQGTLTWDIAITTHSGDLSRLDLGKRASLRTNKGELEGISFQWDVIVADAHHPSGRLSATGINSEISLIPEDSDYIELVLMGVGPNANLERVFRWERLALPTFSGKQRVSTDPAPTSSAQASNFEYYAYIANAADGTVSVIDTQSLKVIRTLAVGNTASHGIAVSPGGDLVYIGNPETGTLLAVDSRSGVTQAEYPVDSNVHGIDRSPDGKHILVGSGGTNEEPILVAVHTATQTLTRITEGINPPGHIAFAPDGDRFYVANLNTDTLTVMDAGLMEAERVVEVGDGPNESRPTPDGRYVFVANWLASEVAVVDTKTWQVTKRIDAGEGTHGVAVSPDGKSVWITNRVSNDIAVIDVATLSVVARIGAGEYTNHVAFTPDGKYVYVTNGKAAEVMAFDATTQELIARIPVGNEPHEIAFGPRP